jgi:hypothetical protein
MQSVQNLNSFWHSSQNYFVLVLFCSLHSTLATFLNVSGGWETQRDSYKYCQFKYNYHWCCKIDAIFNSNVSKTYRTSDIIFSLAYCYILRNALLYNSNSTFNVLRKLNNNLCFIAIAHVPLTPKAHAQYITFPFLTKVSVHND